MVLIDSRIRLYFNSMGVVGGCPVATDYITAMSLCRFCSLLLDSRVVGDGSLSCGLGLDFGGDELMSVVYRVSSSPK